MKWDQISRNWERMKVLARERWAKLGDRDLELIDGDRHELILVLAERYKWPRQRAELEVQDWQGRGVRPPSFNPPQSLRKAG
jgi:uncharacterized protein YjbJ (UPF0337 family)